MRKKTKGNYENDLNDVVNFMKENRKTNIYESDWLELMRYGLRHTDYLEIANEQDKLKNDMRKFTIAKNMKAFEESLMKYESFTYSLYSLLGEYEKIFESLLGRAKLLQVHMTISDYFYTYCGVSDSLVSFILNNKNVTISHNVRVYVYDQERKKLENVFNEFINKFSTEIIKSDVPVSETIELMIRKDKLLPNTDPVTKKYTASGSTPDTIAWLKLNNLHKIFPPKLFDAMINTKCKLRIIEKYYRDL